MGDSAPMAAQQNHDEIEVQFEHTYQLGPADTEKFNPEQVKAVINDIFEKKFGDGFEYNADDAADMGTDVCTEIQDRVKGNLLPTDCRAPWTPMNRCALNASGMRTTERYDLETRITQ